MIMKSQKPLAISHQPKLKVCGLTRPDQIQELILLEADFLGFIFYGKSPRYVLNHLSLEEISMMNHQGKVGVFVNESPENVINTADQAKLDFIQLHGDEDEHFIAGLKKKLNPAVRLIKVIRIGNQDSDELQRIINQQAESINYFLFDTDSKAFGGTGKTFDWNILNQIKIPLPYFLSGGISEENSDQVRILDQKPFALDINSRFETQPGVKNMEKIKKFKDYIR